MTDFEISKSICSVFAGRQRLCGLGIAVARPQPRQYVPCRRQLLFAFGQAAKYLPPSASVAQRLGGCRYCDNGGICGRTSVQPLLWRLGLSQYAPECSWADMPPLLSCVGAGQSWGDGTLQLSAKASSKAQAIFCIDSASALQMRLS